VRGGKGSAVQKLIRLRHCNRQRTAQRLFTTDSVVTTYYRRQQFNPANLRSALGFMHSAPLRSALGFMHSAPLRSALGFMHSALPRNTTWMHATTGVSAAKHHRQDGFKEALATPVALVGWFMNLIPIGPAALARTTVPTVPFGAEDTAFGATSTPRPSMHVKYRSPKKVPLVPLPSAGLKYRGSSVPNVGWGWHGDGRALRGKSGRVTNVIATPIN
jgi:hypothetical protein